MPDSAVTPEHDETSEENAMADERSEGVIEKYRVQRLDDPTGWFFVLDIKHDPLAREALRCYALKARLAGYTRLSDDLFERLAPWADEEPVFADLEGYSRA